MDEQQFISLLSGGGLVLACLVVLGLLAFSMIYRVNERHPAVLETFGVAHKKASMPGLHVKLPWPITIIKDTVGTKTRYSSETLTFRTTSVALDSGEQAKPTFVKMPITAQWVVDELDPTNPVKAYYEPDNLDEQVKEIIMNGARAVAGTMTLDQIFTDKSHIQEETIKHTRADLAEFGVRLKTIQVEEPQPSDDVKAAYDKVVAADRNLEAARKNAEAVKVELEGHGRGVAAQRGAVFDGFKADTEKLVEMGLTVQQAADHSIELIRLASLTEVGKHGNVLLLDLAKDGSNVGHTVAATTAGVRASNRLGTAQPQPTGDGKEAGHVNGAAA